jgi:hypothetical protein
VGVAIVAVGVGAAVGVAVGVELAGGLGGRSARHVSSPRLAAVTAAELPEEPVPLSLRLAMAARLTPEAAVTRTPPITMVTTRGRARLKRM